MIYDKVVSRSSILTQKVLNEETGEFEEKEYRREERIEKEDGIWYTELNMTKQC